MKFRKKIKKRKSRKAKLIRNIIGIVVISGVLIWFAELKINTENRSEYSFTLPYEERTLSSFTTTTGKIVMRDITSVSTDVTQKVKKIYYNVGDSVEEGDILCEFESGELDEQIERIEKLISDKIEIENLEKKGSKQSDDYTNKSQNLALESAKLSLSTATKEYDMAYSKFDEYYNIYYNSNDENEIALYYTMYKNYESQLDSLRDKKEQAQKYYDDLVKQIAEANDQKKSSDYIKSFQTSDIAEYEKNLEKLKKERDSLVVRADRSGIISECFISEGGYAVDSCLFRIGTLGDYKLELYVGDSNILSIKPETEIAFKSKLTGMNEISGKITSVSDILINQYGSYVAEADITDTSYMNDLRPNVIVNVKIYSENIGKHFAVQYDAIFSDENENKYVYRAVKKGDSYKAERVNVETGYEADYYVEIVSSELKEGDLILSSDVEYSDGETIKIKEMAG